MSFPKVKGKQGDSCILREGTAPAWCKMGQGLSPRISVCLCQETCPPTHLSSNMPCLLLNHPFLKPGKLQKRKEEKTPNSRVALENTLITATITPAICESKGKGVGCENSSREELSLEFECPSLLRRTNFHLCQKIQQRAGSAGLETERSGSEICLLMATAAT